MRNYVHPLLRAGLYRFKRNYGFPIDINKLESASTDPITGQMTRDVTVIHVNRAVCLCGADTRRQLTRKMAAGTEASRDFAASGSYDVGGYTFIIDKQDAPQLPELGQDDWIVHDNRRFQIVKVDGVDRECWDITARELKGEQPCNITNQSVTDALNVSEVNDGQ